MYTIGAGSAEEGVTTVNGMMPVQRQPIDEDTMRKIAETTGGKIIRAAATEQLMQAYEEIDRLETTENRRRRLLPVQDGVRAVGVERRAARGRGVVHAPEMVRGPAMNIQFAFPSGQWPLWLAVGAAVLAAVYFVLHRFDLARARRLHAFVEAKLAPRLLEGYDVRLQRLLRWLALAGVALLLLALAQPKWGQGMTAIGREGRDILILLDTSESMNAANPAPDAPCQGPAKD